MKNELLTFNDLPQVVAQLRDEVMGMKVALLNLQNGTTQQKRENTHRPMSVEEAAEYTRLPLGTMYQKLAEDSLLWSATLPKSATVSLLRLRV